MDRSLYHHELDGLPPTNGPVVKADGLARPGVADSPRPSKVKATRGPGRLTLAERIAAASPAELVGFSLAAGVLASIPLVLMMWPRPDDRPRPPTPRPSVLAHVGLARAISKEEPSRVAAPAPRPEAEPLARVEATDPPGSDLREESPRREVTSAPPAPAPPELPTAPEAVLGDRPRRARDMARRMAKARNQAMLSAMDQQLAADVRQALVRAASTAPTRVGVTSLTPFGYMRFP